MSHYIYRFRQWYIHGHMLFDDSWFTLGCIMVHIGLSTSSLIFHIPNTRNRAAPMIWPEFRLHSIIFAMRSLTIIMYHWTSMHHNWIFSPQSSIVMLTMMLADKVTEAYPLQGSTMRVMPFPNYVTDSFKRRLNLFYSVSQVYATIEVLTRPTMSYAFMVLFPIQISALLMTCVRKSIITADGWHFWYTLSLLSTSLYSVYNTEEPMQMQTKQLLVYHGCALYFIVRRFIYKNNKYLLWTHVTIIHQISQYVL